MIFDNSYEPQNEKDFSRKELEVLFQNILWDLASFNDIARERSRNIVKEENKPESEYIYNTYEILIKNAYLQLQSIADFLGATIGDIFLKYPEENFTHLFIKDPCAVFFTPKEPIKKFFISTP